MLQAFTGLGLGLAVGAICRAFDIPSPAPPRIIGAVILIAMTVGFIAAGQITGAP
jgi:XapX domain-containing protein